MSYIVGVRGRLQEDAGNERNTVKSADVTPQIARPLVIWCGLGACGAPALDGAVRLGQPETHVNGCDMLGTRYKAIAACGPLQGVGARLTCSGGTQGIARMGQGVYVQACMCSCLQRESWGAVDAHGESWGAGSCLGGMGRCGPFWGELEQLMWRREAQSAFVGMLCEAQGGTRCTGALGALGVHGMHRVYQQTGRRRALRVCVRRCKTLVEAKGAHRDASALGLWGGIER